VGRVLTACRDDGHLLLMSAGSDGTVVRWMPPLVVSAAEVDRALDVFAVALSGCG
jgi:4-aminobutyrate aminotransferase